MNELIQMGGLVTWFQLVLFFFALIFTFERILFFQTLRVKEDDLLLGLGNQLRRRAYAEAIHEASLASGSIGRVLHTILTRYHLSRSELRGVAEDAVGLELPRIENNMRALMALVLLAPLSGMLGTVLGMMDIFFEVNGAGGFATQAKMAEGLFESLFTTVVGLTMATGIYIIYIYLSSRARRAVNRLDAAAVSLVNIIIDARNQNEILSFHEVTQEKEPLERELEQG